MTQVSITVEQEIPVTYAPVTEGGQPAEVEGGLQTEVLEGDVTTRVEGMEVVVVSGSTIGSARVRVFADADLGPETSHIEDIIEVTLSGARAASFGVTVGTPRPKQV